MVEMIKTKISKGYQTVFPSEIRRKIGGEPGDEIIWSVIGDDVYLHVKKHGNEDPIKALIGAFETTTEDDSTRDLDHAINE
jgi:bifunctional DNA-binding transcriptional regulator/antitoxin component of YhaV-PrlF toxin-antitoxin module